MPAQAQRCLHPGGLDSKQFVFNTEIGGLVEYPNFRSPGGVVDGDAFWKVIPAELFQRIGWGAAPSNPTTITNFQNLDSGQGAPVFHHRYEYRHVTRDANGHLVPDFARPAFRWSVKSETAGIPSAGNWLYRHESLSPPVLLDPSQQLGIAFVLYGKPGLTPTSANVQRGVYSKGERYDQAPQPSFSGVRDGKTGQLALLVPPLLPVAAEFQFIFGYMDAMVSVSATSAGGALVPEEMNTGVGAFYNDLASRGGKLRLYVEEDAFTTTSDGWRQSIIVPLLSTGRTPRWYWLPGFACPLEVDPLDPLATLPLALGWTGFFYARYSNSNLAEAFAWTPWLDIPQSAALIGVRLHFEVLTVSVRAGLEGVVSKTNSIEMVLQ
jgi:hypothetical protein